MATEIKKKKAVKPKKSITTLVKDYGSDPFFIAKTKESKAFLEANGFPKTISNLSNEILKKHQEIVLDRVRKSKKDPSRMLQWEEASKTLTC